MQADKDGLDQPFEDYAWSQMSTLLDQELPVQEERKRRWLFWLLLFFGLSVGGAVAYQMFQAEEQETVDIDRPIAEHEVLDNERLTENNEQLEEETSESRGESQDELLLEKKNSGAKNEIISSESIASIQIEQDRTNSNNVKLPQTRSNQATVSRQKNSNVVSKNSNDQIPSSDSQIPISQSPILNSELSINDQQLTNSLPSQSINPSIHQPFDPLPTVRSMNISPIEPITSATRSSIAEPVVRKISKWELAARLGGIATLDGETHFTLGTDVQYHFKPKWSITSGVSWIVKQNNNMLFSSNEADLAFPMNMDSSMSGNRFTQEANTADQDILVRDSVINVVSPQHHFLSIPLSMEYRINNRFSAYAGVQVLLPFNRGKSAYEEQFATTAINTAGTVSYIQQKGLFNADPLRSNWQWHTGVHFRASDRFSFDFSYHNILPKQRGRNHLEQYFQLGMRYNFVRLK